MTALSLELIWRTRIFFSENNLLVIFLFLTNNRTKCALNFSLFWCHIWQHSGVFLALCSGITHASLETLMKYPGLNWYQPHARQTLSSILSLWPHVPLILSKFYCLPFWFVSSSFSGVRDHPSLYRHQFIESIKCT